MKVIVGLGNPGKQYDGTRHNVGFCVAAELARRHGPGTKPRSKFGGQYVDCRIADHEVMLVWPLTYMNESGRCVRKIIEFYRLPVDDLLIVCDDFNLPLGRIRLRGSGSSGGQNGLEDILNQLQTENVPRLRMGIGPLAEGWVARNFVLSRFATEERGTIEKIIGIASDACESWVADGLTSCMSRYNGTTV